MKKIAILLLLFFSLIGYSQQTLKRIIESDTEFIIELFIFRNDLSNCDINGDETFDGASGGAYYGYSRFINNVPTYYSHSANNYLNQNNLNLPTIQLGTENFNFISPWSSRRFVSYDEGEAIYQGETLISYMPLIAITTETYSGRASGTNSVFANMLYGKLILKKALNDGSPVSNDLWVYFNTWNIANSNLQYAGKTWYGKYNGTNWVEQNTDMFGNAVDYIPSICAELSNQEISKIDDKILIFPNPSSESISIQNIGNTNKNYNYEIIDYVGRVVKIGNSNYGDAINISNLESGNYIIEVISDNQKNDFKIIKN